MKILLFGEFSGLFTCLKRGLVELGHEVFFVSDGNGFKDYPSDFRYDSHKSARFGRFRAPYNTCNLYLHRHLLKGFDIVYLMDPNLISRHVGLNAPIYRYILKHNKKVFLCGAGDTAIMIDYWLKTDEKYHNYVDGILAPHRKSGRTPLYLKPELKEWENELMNSVDGYIPIWYEYAQPFRNYKSTLKTVRIPIPYQDFDYKPNVVKDKIVFFHGVSTRPQAKGTPYIKEAFRLMEQKYGDVAEFHCAGGLPFNEYMDLVSRTNVILDDANSYSIAMNGLFSLAKGKIVMGGAEPEGNKELGIDGVNPVINLKPDVGQICSQIEYVIENKDKIEAWGLAGRKFVEQYHDYIQIAKEYELIFKKALENE